MKPQLLLACLGQIPSAGWEGWSCWCEQRHPSTAGMLPSAPAPCSPRWLLQAGTQLTLLISSSLRKEVHCSCREFIFLLQVDWYSCTSIFQHGSAKSAGSGWSRRDFFSSARARQNCSAGAGAGLQIWSGLGAAGMLNSTWGNTGQGRQGIKIYRGKHQVNWSTRGKIRIWGGIWCNPRRLAALCLWAWV